MNVSYDALVHMLNIWLVFESTGPIEIISNSLAMQFAMALDDEFKELYFKYTPASEVGRPDCACARGRNVRGLRV
jgi:hypothetical protein|eukprot:3946225-Prymnesium_polylepis.1